MTGPELRKLRERLKLTPTAAAASIGVSARTWQRWEASKTIPASMVRFIRLAVAVKAVIAERDQFDGQDTLDTIDDALGQLRKALL